MIACQAALYAQEWLHNRGFGTEVHLRFVEKNKRTANLLRAARAPFTGKLDCVVVDGTAEDAAPALVAESRGHPTLAFLDPDGFKELPFEVVRSFGHRYTEVLISFDVQGVMRVAGLVSALTIESVSSSAMHRPSQSPVSAVAVVSEVIALFASSSAIAEPAARMRF